MCYEKQKNRLFKNDRTKIRLYLVCKTKKIKKRNSRYIALYNE